MKKTWVVGLLSTSLAIGLYWPSYSRADTTDADAITVAVGAGVNRIPSFAGAKTQRSEPIPYVDFEWPNHVSVSTLDGLQVDLIGGDVLHGGIYGDYRWGRDREDLGHTLGGKIPTLAPRFTGGGYLEWQLTKQVDAGTSLSHDINGAGEYLQIYAEWDPPKIWLLEQSFEVRWQALNAAAMNRLFGFTPGQASLLDVPTWHPGAGSQLADLEYDVFVPTSKHTGIALALTCGRLLGGAAGSPLVRRFGSRTQISESLAFIYHL